MRRQALSLDKVLLGDQDEGEIITNLTDLRDNWFLGMETDSRLDSLILILDKDILILTNVKLN